MSSGIRHVLFLVRAYNDLDIQLPLIKEFSADPRFKVTVVFHACDGFIASPDSHEAVKYISRHYRVNFQLVTELSGAPAWLRIASRLERFFNACRMNRTGNIPVLSFILKVCDVGLRKLMQPALQRDAAWLFQVSKNWNPAILFTDEILFQPGRSPVIDTVVPALVGRGAAVYAILTGHRVYTAVNPTGQEAENNYRPSPAKRYFVPSEHNKKIYRVLFPQENITVGGNLRMDREWIEFLHTKILPAPPALPHKPIKIALMLSKLNYGVGVEAMKETIRQLGNMPGVVLAIKPHTRGMKFDFMKNKEIGSAVIADKIPSASLIEWADIVLMTGSSIVFHAMLKGKVAGFLQYCQDLETIFDDGKSAVCFKSLDELTSYAFLAVKNGVLARSAADKSALDAFIKHEIHGEIESGRIAGHYKAVVLKDLGLDD